jgi:RNA polymerase sigma-70 factor (ECF subfamily)
MESPPVPTDAEGLLAAAQGGSALASGRLLESCRSYLLLVAGQELGPQYRAKVGPSDLVQETIAEAHRSLPNFRGRTERELLGWLRGILLHNLCDLARRYESDCRHVAQEVPLSADGGRFSPAAVPAPEPPPEDLLIAREQSQALLDALARLPDVYREVLRLRYDEKRPFEEIGRALGRSAEAARKLWLRAIESLRTEMGAYRDGDLPGRPGE